MILVTGASGLIGSHVLPLLATDHDVFAISRRGQNSRGRATWLASDLTCDEVFADLPPKVDTVLHLAQSERYRDFPDGALDVFGVNVASTARLLAWGRERRVRRFILASSGGIASTAAANYYLATKHSAELLAEAYGGYMDVLILRFHFVYGRRQREMMLIPRLVKTVLDGRPVHLAGADGFRLNPVHVSDAAAAVVQAVVSDVRGRVDIAGPHVLTLREVTNIIATRAGRAATFVVESDAVPTDVVGDIRDMCRLLVPPRISFADGVGDVCQEWADRVRRLGEPL